MSFLDTLQEARSPHNQIITGLGNGWVECQSNQIPGIEKAVSSAASKHGVDPGYLRYSLLTPEGKRVLHRHDLKDLWVLVSIWETLGSPRVGALTVPEDESVVLKAAQELNSWAGSTLRTAVGHSLVMSSRTKVTDMRRTLKDMYGREMNPNAVRVYLLDKFQQAVESRPQWFTRPGFIQMLQQGWSRPL